MAAPEHLELSSYIKNVHLSLRNKSKEVGYDSAWKQHCKNDDCLQKYAASMQELATKYWDKNAKDSSKVISRIEWVYTFCDHYFFGAELRRQRSRELDILSKIVNIEDTSFETCDNFDRLRLLDVGSCYNPFKVYDCFEVTPVDIAPANEEVYKCDFINIKIGDQIIYRSRTIEQLEQNSFHVVVFSLLLEYLPSSEQRLSCCKNAYNLLKTEGILIIITPDSKHVGANAKYMKSWRYALSLVGFARIKYEKLPYLHCMTFRKSIHSEVPKRWAKMHENDDLSTTLHIPQDFQETEDIFDPPNRDDVKINLLSELPFDTV